jgi:hypothetical protein
MYKTLLYKWFHFWADVQYYATVGIADLFGVCWNNPMTSVALLTFGVVGLTVLSVCCCVRCMRRTETKLLVKAAAAVALGRIPDDAQLLALARVPEETQLLINKVQRNMRRRT